MGKEHLFVLVKTKNGIEKREVKATSSDYKIKDKIMHEVQKGLYLNKKLEKK